jgi:hypothetical protein
VVRPFFSDTSAYTRNALVEGLRSHAVVLTWTARRPKVANALSGAYHTDGHPARAHDGRPTWRAPCTPARTTLRFGPMIEALRKGVEAKDMLMCAASAGALGEAGDSASVPLLASAYATRGP